MKKPNNTQKGIKDSAKAKAYKTMVRENLDSMIADWGKPTASQQLYIKSMEHQLKQPNRHF